MPSKRPSPRASESVHERVAKRIQQARREARGGKGYTQQELSEKLGVSPITLSRWENGARTPSFQDLERVAEEAGRQISFFFEEEPQEDDFEKTLLRATRDMSDEDKEEILAYIRFRYQRWYDRQTE